ncbi:hypothetical protein [Actinopolyspora erythraea]|uniref:hypothetical protein n=1 Tax=Actinopolyspora erythraea TaxID=414996 RepID=UPI0006934C16|nr:hypothetical protein [Actinopolyspora erythraea]
MSTEALPPPLWEPPEPHRVPALREQLVDQLRSPWEMAMHTTLLRSGKGTINPDPARPDRAAASLLADEDRRLRGASLYSVTSEMTLYAREAGEKLPDWEVRRDDLPSTSGFMVFDEPMGYYLNDDNPNLDRPATITIVAVSWGPTRFGTTENLWVTFWSVTDFDRQAEAYRRHGLAPDEADRIARQQRGPLTWDNEVLLNFQATGWQVYEHDRPVDVSAEQLISQSTAPWVNTVRAAWLLMKQSSIAATTAESLPRSARRRAERQGLPSGAVTVVHLNSRRRRASPATRGKGHAHTVRYPVSGHWRSQPYPSRQTTERIWIEDHERGPEDAPFRPGRKHTVRVLDAPPQ